MKEQLIERYCSRTSQERTPTTEEDIAFLLDNLTGEQIFFSIGYLSKHRTEAIKQSPRAVLDYWSETKVYFELAKARQLKELNKESEVTYDQRNNYKGTDTPSWFRKSFDINLFK
jgi:hypothetical protein